jgi:hypothetical protein
MPTTPAQPALPTGAAKWTVMGTLLLSAFAYTLNTKGTILEYDLIIQALGTDHYRNQWITGPAAVVGLAIVVPGWSASAHHAFAAEFDAKKPVKLRGTVTKMEWINPHAWVHIDVKKDDGSVDEWMIEAGTPNTLLRRGFTRDSLKPGTEIIVDGYQSKDGSLRANGRDVTLPNGQTLFLGTSDSPDDKSNDKK